MPISPSPKRSARPSVPPPPQGFRYRPLLILVAVLAVLTVGIVALPASLVKRFLPPAIQAEDFSGSLWHGSAGRISLDSRDAGAIEWRIHPWSLLALTVAADVHWVKVGFVADSAVNADRHGLTARNVVGGGPIEDLRDMGVAAGWHGTSQFKFKELKFGFDGDSARDGARLLAAVGDLSVSNLASPQIAAGTDLGGYDLHLADGAITPDTDATAELIDTGGPLEVHAAIHYSAKDRTGLLSGTVKERAAAPAALRGQIANLLQLHARDSEGRIPFELEFTL